MNGGDLIASALQAQATRFLFTLCGGHISPILVSCKQRGIRVIDTRHEATAVFAADAVARLTGRPGVAAVTAGPGLTNTITAVKNAQIAQSPVVLLGGAAATALKGRGALQDIDQIALLRPHVKWAGTARRVAELPALLEQAFYAAQSGVPGPVFLECPIDLLYDEAIVRQLYGAGSGGRGLAARATRLYLRQHVRRLFAGMGKATIGEEIKPVASEPDPATVAQVAQRLHHANRPVLLVGSQALLAAHEAAAIAQAVERLGIPTYLSGMARGLLGREHALHLRHQRRIALREADLVLLAGVPCDFRLDYGRQIGRRAYYIAANRSRADLKLNRRPNIGVLGNPGMFLRRLADTLEAPEGGHEDTKARRIEKKASIGQFIKTWCLRAFVAKPSALTDAPEGGHEDTKARRIEKKASIVQLMKTWCLRAFVANISRLSDAERGLRWSNWHAQLRARDQARNEQIAQQAHAPAAHINPIQLCRAIEDALDPSAILIGDGGDFVATASYTVRPRGPLTWLDPGAFGTLGVGAGFALGAKLVHPEAEVWALFGDGALGYSLAEFDTFARHGIAIIAVVGNDAGWTQIAREQVEMLHDDVGVRLAHTDYHHVATGLGAAGLRVDDPELVPEILQQARQIAASGQPVLVNAILGTTDFRKGSISM